MQDDPLYGEEYEDLSNTELVLTAVGSVVLLGLATFGAVALALFVLARCSP